MLNKLILRRASRTAQVAFVGLIAIGGALRVASGISPSDLVNGALSNLRLFVNPNSPAAHQADAWQRSRPADAALMRYVASQPTAQWVGEWNSDIRRDVTDATTRAAQQGTLPVLVAYNIPSRDCGSYSAGGAKDAGYPTLEGILSDKKRGVMEAGADPRRAAYALGW